MEYFNNKKQATYGIFLSARQVELLASLISCDPMTKPPSLTPEAVKERMELRRRVRVMQDAVKRREKKVDTKPAIR
jgi:hypothetical protein